MKKIDKFKFCRNIESKLHTLKRDLHRKNKLHEESLSKMFSYIIGEDPVDLTTSYDMNTTKKSFWLFKENTASDENVDGNILEMLSSSIGGDSILKQYKKGLRSNSNLNQTENFNNHASPKLKQFLLKKRSNIQKERAIKILIRKILEIYFENLLTFFKMCAFIEPKSKFHNHRTGKTTKYISDKVANKENQPEVRHLESITSNLGFFSNLLTQEIDKLPNKFSFSKYMVEEKEVLGQRLSTDKNVSLPRSEKDPENNSDSLQENENVSSNLTKKFDEEFLNSKDQINPDLEENQTVIKMASSSFFQKPADDENSFKKESPQEDDKFYDTKILWTVHSELNDILVEYLIKKNRPLRSMKKGFPKETKLSAAPEESVNDEILKSDQKWFRTQEKSSEVKSFLPEYPSSALKSKMKLSGLESLNMTQIQEKIQNERQNAKSNSMSESYLVSKLKDFQEDLLSSSMDAKRNNQENSLLHEKLLRLTDKIKSVKMAPQQSSMIQQEPEEAHHIRQENPLQDITNKFTQSVEFKNFEELQGAEPEERVSQEHETLQNSRPPTKKVKKPHSFVTKLRTFNKLFNALIELSEYKTAFLMICEHAKEKKLYEELNREIIVDKSSVSPTANEFKKLRKEESKNLVFASFSHALPELMVPLNLGSPERVSEANEPSSPDFSIKQCPSHVSRYAEVLAPAKEEKQLLTAETFQGILKLEESLLCIFRKFYRIFFDNTQDLFVDDEDDVKIPSEEVIEERERLSHEVAAAPLMSQVSNENLLDLSSKQMSQSRKETEEDLHSPYIVERNKNHPHSRKNFTEEDENDTELLRYSDFSSLSKQIQKVNKDFEREGDEIEKMVAYILKNPALREELKSKMGMPATEVVQEEDQKEWRENLEHTLESTLEKKLEAKLRQLLEEKLDKKQLAQSTGTREMYPLPRSNKTTSPNRPPSSQKDYYGPGCFTNLTTPRPAVSTYMNENLRGSYIDWQENEMDGSMQKFQPLTDVSVREEGNVLTESRGTRYNCLDDVLYIYQSSVHKGESLPEEGTQGTFDNFDSKFDPATSDNMASDRHHRLLLKNRYPSIEDENSDLLRELQMDTQEDEKRHSHRAPSGLSRNIHFYYVLDHIFTKKMKVILSEIFTKLKDCPPLISMFYSSVSESQETFSNFDYTQSRPLITSTFTEFEKEYRTSPATIGGYSMIQPVNNRRSWILSESYPTAVSMTLHKTKFVRGLLEVCSVWDRIYLKRAFYALNEHALDVREAEEEERAQRIELEKRQLYEVMQKMFAFVNILQRNEWKNLKSAFANIASSKQEQEKDLRCLVLLNKMEELYKKSLRQSFTKIYYDNTQHEKQVALQRNEAAQKIASVLKTNLKSFGFNAVKEYAFYLMMRDEKLEKLCYLIEYKRVELIWHGLVKIASYSQMRKEFMLYAAKLCQVLREVEKSKLKAYFFLLKKKSQAIFMRDFERRTSLKKVLNNRLMKEYEQTSNSFRIWKGFVFEVNRRLSRSFRESWIPQQQPLTKEKLYLANFLYKLFYRKTIENIHASLINIELRACKVTAIQNISNVLRKHVLERFAIALNEIQDESETKLIEQQRLTVEARKSVQQYQQHTQEIGIKEKIEKFEALMETLKRNNMQKGLRVIELHFISRKNLESLCINLVLKTVLLIKNKADNFKKIFFNKLAHNYRRELKNKKILKAIILRKHVKCLSYSFNKFRTRLLTLKASKSAINLLNKNYLMAFDKLSKLTKTRFSDPFNIMKALFAPSPPQQVKTHQRTTSGTKKHSRGSSVGPVLTIDLTAKPPSRHSTPRSVRWQDVKLAHNMENFVKKIQGFWLRIGWNALVQETQNCEITMNQRYYIAMNIVDKIVFRHKLVNFLHWKKMTEAHEEDEDDISPFAMSRDTRRSSWQSFEGMDIEYFKQKEQKISGLRMRKYFTEWRLMYIKYAYHKNKIDCAFNKLFSVFLKTRIDTLNSAFKLLKELHGPKSNVIKITLVPSRGSVEPRPSERKSVQQQSPSITKSRERFTKSPGIAPTHHRKKSSTGASRPNQSPRRIEAYSINLLGDSERKSHNNQSGRKSYNQSVSPAPTSRRQSDYSPGSKRESARFGFGGSNRQSANKSNRSPAIEKSMSRLSARDSVYSIVGK